jgi:hypothetical protein
MTLEEARAKLIEQLGIVLEQFDKGDDDWQPSLLHTFFKYSEAIGVERKLLVPILKMYIDGREQVLKARRREDGVSSKFVPHNRALALTAAAACVTVLKNRGDMASIGKAIEAVSKASGLEQKEIKKFRDGLHRATYSDEVLRSYEDMIKEVGGWATPDMLKSISVLSKFVNL